MVLVNYLWAYFNFLFYGYKKQRGFRKAFDPPPIPFVTPVSPWFFNALKICPVPTNNWQVPKVYISMLITKTNRDQTVDFNAYRWCQNDFILLKQIGEIYETPQYQ